MANIFESAFMTLKNGMTMYFADSKARKLIEKLKALVDTKYGPDNPPPAGKIWYATCSTASGTGAKTATTTTGDFALATGSMVRILFTTSNTAANPTISIDGSTAKAIRPISSASGMANKIAAGEVIDLVYDGSNFVMTKGNAATTSFYGITKLSSATNSTAEDVAATPKAVKTVADAKVDKAGDTMTGSLVVSKAGEAVVKAINTNTSVAVSMTASAATTHGLWTYGYYDGSVYHSDAKWMIYRNSSGDVIVNGRATDDFNLTLGTNIPDNSDLNDYKTAGTYYVASSTNAATITNSPITSAGYKLVVVSCGSILNLRQIAFINSSNNIRARMYDGSTWGSWYTNYTAANIIPIGSGGTGATTSANARKNLELCYEVNNTETFSGYSRALPGVVLVNNSVYMDVVTPKSMENITSVTVTEMSGIIRGVNGTIDSIGSNTDYTTLSGYTVTATKIAANTIRVLVKKSSNFTNFTNNTPTCYFGTLKLKFT